jgi:N-acetylneuraminic acid mutarotase
VNLSKRKITGPAAGFLFAAHWVFAQGTWTRMNDFPGLARTFPVAFTVGTKGYMGTGQDASGNLLNDFWEYDATTDAWTQRANFGGTARYGAVGFGIGTKGYLGTGSSSAGPTADFWEYNPSTNTWTAKANYGGGAVSGSGAFSISSTSKGYIGGSGLDNLSNFTKKFYEYDPTANTWTSKAQPPFAFGTPYLRYWGAAFSVGTKGYILSGMSCCGAYAKDLYEYNPSTNTWASRAAYTTGYGLWNTTAFSIGTKGYFVTGEDEAGTIVLDHKEYNPTTNTWAAMANFGGTARQGSASFVLNGCGYVIAGRDGTGALREVWKWCPTTVLPIELISFSGEFKNETVELTWTTATELNNDFFTVERSADAVNFETAGIVKGAGNSNSTLNYSFTDEIFAKENVLYYRLKQTDADNSFSYSQVIEVKRSNTEENFIFYDASSNELHAGCEIKTGEQVLFEISDLSGQKIFERQLTSERKGKNNFTLALPALSSGIYIVRFSDAQGAVIARCKFVKP